MLSFYLLSGTIKGLSQAITALCGKRSGDFFIWRHVCGGRRGAAQCRYFLHMLRMALTEKAQ